jgi:hypothetical protein
MVKMSPSALRAPLSCDFKLGTLNRQKVVSCVLVQTLLKWEKQFLMISV